MANIMSLHGDLRLSLRVTEPNDSKFNPSFLPQS